MPLLSKSRLSETTLAPAMTCLWLRLPLVPSLGALDDQHLGLGASAVLHLPLLQLLHARLLVGRMRMSSSTIEVTQRATIQPFLHQSHRPKGNQPQRQRPWLNPEPSEQSNPAQKSSSMDFGGLAIPIPTFKPLFNTHHPSLQAPQNIENIWGRFVSSSP